MLSTPIILSCIASCILGFLIAKMQALAAVAAQKAQWNFAVQKNSELTAANLKMETDIEQKDQTIHQLIAEVSQHRSEAFHLQDQLNRQQTEFEKVHQQFATEFRNVANDILEEKSKRFAEQNKTGISEILFPLSEKIKDFEKKVEATYDRELREQVSLKTEIKNLFELNRKLSDEANNLARALKGDKKLQGNWGELMLERILEQSGLTLNREYCLQHATQNASGENIQPDAVILLPGNKHLIIDAKVSLIAYEKALNAINDQDRAQLLKDHVQSVKNHVRLLGQKQYHAASGTHAPDFVFLFLWSEAAFSAAIQSDESIFQYAWERNIAIVSPTTIWANLRTIAHLWRREKQQNNAVEIARQGADLYDKFVGFAEDLMMIGKKMDEAKRAHDEAMNKLQSGTGNLVRRAEKMKAMGLKPSKQIPASLIETSAE